MAVVTAREVFKMRQIVQEGKAELLGMVRELVDSVKSRQTPIDELQSIGRVFMPHGQGQPFDGTTTQGGGTDARKLDPLQPIAQVGSQYVNVAR